MEKFFKFSGYTSLAVISIALSGCASTTHSTLNSPSNATPLANSFNQQNPLKPMTKFHQNYSFEFEHIRVGEWLNFLAEISGQAIVIEETVDKSPFLTITMQDKPLWFTADAVLQASCLSATMGKDERLHIFANKNQSSCQPQPFKHLPKDSLTTRISGDFIGVNAPQGLGFALKLEKQNFVIASPAQPPTLTVWWTDKTTNEVLNQVLPTNCFNHKKLDDDSWLISQNFAPKDCQINPAPLPISPAILNPAEDMPSPNVNIISKTNQYGILNLPLYQSNSFYNASSDLTHFFEKISQKTSLNILLDKTVNINTPQSYPETKERVADMLENAMLANCLRYQPMNENSIFVTSAKDQSACKTFSTPTTLIQSNSQYGKPLSLDISDMPNLELIKLLTSQVNKFSYIANPDFAIQRLGINITDKPPATILDWVMKVSCGKYRQLENGNIALYPATNTKQDHDSCLNSLALSPATKLADIRPLNRKITIKNDPLSFWQLMHANTVQPILDGAMINYILDDSAIKTLQDPDSNNSNDMLHIPKAKTFKITADNQPVYKILQSVLESQCFSYSPLANDVVFIAKDPKNTTCQPAPAGSEIIVH